MIKINLLAVKEAKKRANAQNQLVAVVIVFVIVFVGIGYIAFSRRGNINRLNEEIAQKQRDLTRLQETQKKVEQFKKDNENLQQKITVITDLETGRDWYLQILDQLSEAMPEGVWITTLDTPKGGKGGASIYSGNWEIKGGAQDKDQVGNLISNLEKRNKFFTAVVLKKITKQAGGEETGTYFKYEMSITITKPPKAEAEAG